MTDVMIGEKNQSRVENNNMKEIMSQLNCLKLQAMSNPNKLTEHGESSPKRKQQTCQPEFDPYEHGPEDGIGRWEATISLYRGCTGLSIVLLPFIMRNLGWLLGALTILGTSTVLLHITHVLLSTEKKMCTRLKLKRLSHPDLVGKVFEILPYPLNKLSNPMRLFLLLYFTVSLGNANVLVIMANGIQTLAKFFDLYFETKLVITILVIPLSMVSMFRKILKILVPFSMMTSICTFCLAIIIIVNATIHKNDFKAVTAIGDIRFIPQSVAMLLTIVGVGLTGLAVKNNMARPKEMVSPFGALNVGVLAAVVFNYSFGVISYISYGDNVGENILSNLPQQSYLSFGVILLYTISGNSIYLMNFFSRFDNLWTNTLKSKFGSMKYAWVLEYSIRIGLNLMSYLLAVAVPDLTILCTMMGLAHFILSVLLPAVLELIYLLTDKKKSSWIIFKDACIISVGSFMFVISLNECVEKIKKMYEK